MSETGPVDSIDFFLDLFTDEDDFNSPSGGSGIHSSASEDKHEQGINIDVLDMDDYDTDIIFQFDGQGKGSSTDPMQADISEVLGEDIIPRTATNGQATTLAGCTDFFWLTHIFTDHLEGAHLFNALRQWSRIF